MINYIMGGWWVFLPPVVPFREKPFKSPFWIVPARFLSHFEVHPVPQKGGCSQMCPAGSLVPASTCQTQKCGAEAAPWVPCPAAFTISVGVLLEQLRWCLSRFGACNLVQVSSRSCLRLPLLGTAGMPLDIHPLFIYESVKSCKTNTGKIKLKGNGRTRNTIHRSLL